MRMKQLIFSISFFALSTNLFSQKFIESLTFEEANDINFFRSVKNNTRVGSYQFEDGNTVMVGDTVKLGDPSTERAKTSTIGGGVGYLGAASSTTTTSKEYEFVIYGRLVGFGNFMASMDDDPNRAGTDLKGDQAIIKELRVRHKGSKKKPLEVFALVGELNGRAFGFFKYLTITDLENAWYYGEILLNNVLMTKSEAIEKLKEAKDLLDLEMMTQEEYDKIKSELAPIIRGE